MLAIAIHRTPSSTARDATGVEMRYGSQTEAMPQTTKNAMSARLTRLPLGHRFGRSRKVLANCCMPISARQIDSGTALSASHGEFGHRYSKPKPLSVNSTRPNALMCIRYQK